MVQILVRPVFAAFVLTALVIAAPLDAKNEPRPWQHSSWFEEHFFTTTIEPDVRIHVNAPLDKDGRPAIATRLIVFALPNGNTLEQTLGCKMREGLDWHYDIQHIAAQTRLLRTLYPTERIVLVCVEAPGLSWPSFRRAVPEPNVRIRKLFDDLRKEFATKNAKVTLTGHSGGGAFIFGVIEGGDEIPRDIDRIAWLDANYSFDAALHADKLSRWLDANQAHRLMVVAYDDREIALDGKKVVGPDGGTYRATSRMRDAFAPKIILTDSEHPPFHETVGLDGRMHFFVHPNPENKILHTVLVGEMNGLAHIATLGTPEHGNFGTFGGPRAYTKWVQPEPTAKPDAAPKKAEEKASSDVPKSGFPARPANAMSGSHFIKSLRGLDLAAREAAILREIKSGNFPDFLREFKQIELRHEVKKGGQESEVVAAIDVMPDYLAIGSNDDFVRMPMTPQTAQKIADQFGCVLPTRKLVNAIDSQANVRVAPHPMTRDREAVATFSEHNSIIERERAGKPGLITGIKKDIILTPRIFERPERLAIYGWRQLNGQPIQPLTIVHWDQYVDYSHGARLIKNRITVNGHERRIDEILADPNECGLVSDEGPMKPPRYPTE